MHFARDRAEVADAEPLAGTAAGADFNRAVGAAADAELAQVEGAVYFQPCAAYACYSSLVAQYANIAQQ